MMKPSRCAHTSACGPGVNGFWKTVVFPRTSSANRLKFIIASHDVCAAVANAATNTTNAAYLSVPLRLSASRPRRYSSASPTRASPALANARLERTSRETSCLPCAPTPSTARGVSETREGDRCDVCTSRDAVTTDAITAFVAGARRNPGGPNPMARHRTPSAPSSAPPKATESALPPCPATSDETRFRRDRRDEGFLSPPRCFHERIFTSYRRTSHKLCIYTFHRLLFMLDRIN